MAVLNTLRTKFGLAISIIVALGLLSFIIDPSQVVSALQSSSSKYDVGEINGKTISYTDFQADVDRFSTLNEIVSGSSASNEQQQTQIRNQAWQYLLDQYLFFVNAKKAGINVGEAEMKALLSGETASPLLAQNPMFQDENGAFSPAAVLEFYNSISEDQTGRSQIYWDNLENSVLTQQIYSKYGAMFTASNFQNALQLRNAIAENNNTANVDFVMVPVGFAQDTTVVVSDSEIKEFYNNHKNFFKQKANRDIEYVMFEVTPSAADITAASEKMNAAYEGFGAADNMKSFLSRNSERSYSEYWYRAGELASVNAQVAEFVDANGAGAVSPVYQEGNVFYAAKVLAAAQVPESIQVRIMQAGEATEVVDSLAKALRDLEPIQMTQTYLIPGCESLFTAPVGQPRIIKTVQYGNLIAEVAEKSEPVAKKQVAILQVTANSSNETFNKAYSEAKTFEVLAHSKGYKSAVDSTKTYSRYMPNVLESNTTYGIVENAKEVTRWIFEAKKGDVSEIKTIDQKYFVIATVKDIHKEGYATVAEVAPQIKQQLYGEKAVEKKAQEIAAKISGLTSMEAIAEALGTTVSNQESVAFASLNSQGLDPKFIGAVAAAKEGVISGPVAGQIGVYVFQVNSRDAGAFYTEDDAKNYAAQLNQYTTQMILPVMMESADVKDNRARFY